MTKPWRLPPAPSADGDMVFSSTLFLLAYLPAALLVYYLLPKRLQIPVMFVANLIFYGWGEPVYVLLMLFSIFLNYGAAMFIDAYPSGKKKVLAACVAVNLLALCVFKYAGFLVGSAAAFIPALRLVAVPDIALPIGISFFTFQSMSYVIDVYRGAVAVQKDAVAFGTYVSLFPQLIAGPIVRYEDVEKELASRHVGIADVDAGFKIFLAGLAKKLLLANPLGQMWEALSQAPADNGVAGSWIGIAAFAFQIYFDFSGYSDMAIGIGRMMGFKFLENFDYPYTARSITDFWRRWHISLSTWFRMYVYVPLGGNRKGAVRQVVNLLVVWFLTGLWHGASWNFALWGLYYAVLLIIEKLFLLKALGQLPKAARHAYMLFFTAVGWTLFYFVDFASLGAYLSSMFAAGPAGLISPGAARQAVAYLPTMAACALASTPLPKKLWRRFFAGRRLVLESAFAALLLAVCVAAVVTQSFNPFIYFRF